MTPTTIVIYGLAAGLGIMFWRRRLRSRRVAYITAYALPVGLLEKLRERHPSLSMENYQLVAQALRQFFLAHLNSGMEFVSMPSQIVDDL